MSTGGTDGTESTGLVEPEGTNAGSAASTDEQPDDAAPTPRLRPGGDVGRAPDDGDPATTPSEDAQLAAPADDEQQPSD